MKSPFPGMDPYLETLILWPDVQASLTVAICEQLQPLFRDRYFATLVPSMRPEVLPANLLKPRPFNSRRGASSVVASAPFTGTIAMEWLTRYHHIEIRTVGEEALITAIEILSPVDKRPGADAADAYERKRREIFRSDAHLLEIDLLRDGRRPEIVQPLPDYPYFIFLSRAPRRPTIEIWPVALTTPFPIVPIPLRYPDDDVPLDLNAALAQIYRSARYDYRIDYRQPPPAPELSTEDAAWVDDLLRERGLRSDTAQT